ncbi:hypothetical protein ACIBHY_16950 [Nonomuraea sp. NPDC050547]|uniref:hypothetical protein n=1 Tax=Nonomuraea sp. NPDC050547 TaxID=3364368 RepID=UPI00379A8D0F
MNIIPQTVQQLDPMNISYAVHIWRDGDQISSTEPTTDQDAARDMLRGLQRTFPDSVLVVEGADGVWSPVSDELLDRLARQRAAGALATLIRTSPPQIDWVLSAHAPSELSGHAIKRETVAEFAALLMAECTERTDGGCTTVRASSTFAGVPVSVYCIVRAQDEQVRETASAGA